MNTNNQVTSESDFIKAFGRDNYRIYYDSPQYKLFKSGLHVDLLNRIKCVPHARVDDQFNYVLYDTESAECKVFGVNNCEPMWSQNKTHLLNLTNSFSTNYDPTTKPCVDRLNMLTHTTPYTSSSTPAPDPDPASLVPPPVQKPLLTNHTRKAKRKRDVHSGGVIPSHRARSKSKTKSKTKTKSNNKTNIKSKSRSKSGSKSRSKSRSKSKTTNIISR